MKRIPLREAALLSVYFEETALFQAEQMDAMRTGSSSSSSRRSRNDEGMDIDDVLGGIDEIDFFEARKRGLA